MKKRIAWVDLTETIAISMVVLYHCAAYVGGNYDLNSQNFAFSLVYFLRSVLSACVPLFFLVNGFLLFRQSFNLKKHLFKILKFVLITLFWYVFTLVVITLVARNPDMSFMSNMNSLKSSINHLWYLGALICLYLFFPLLKVVYDHHRPVFIYFTIICAVFVFGNSLMNEIATLVTGTVYSEVNFFRIFNPLRGIYGFSFVYFCLGGILNLCLSKLQSYPRFKLNLLAIFSLVVGWIGQFLIGHLYSSRTGKIWDIIWNGYDTIPTLLITLGILVLCLNYQRENRLFTTISRNTLGIYLIHMIIIFAALYFLESFVVNITSPSGSGLLGLLVPFTTTFYAATVLGISWAISAIWRRIPVLKYLIS